MAVFVINEWLWADLSGQNGAELQRQTFTVIELFPTSDHQIVVIEGSQFDLKAWSLCRNDNPMIVQRIGGAYVADIRQNSDRCRILKPFETVVLPEDLTHAIKADDHYLVQAQLSVPGSILVTSDGPLREILDRAGLPCLSREEFLGAYFS